MRSEHAVFQNIWEQRLEWALLALTLLFVSLIVVGVISQSKGVNYDRVLVPAFFFCGGLFFVLFGLNGIAKGQIVEKWTPYVLSAWIKALTQLFSMGNKNADIQAWKVTLGTVALLVGLFCTKTAISDLYKRA